jgi:hypothetical protein
VLRGISRLCVAALAIVALAGWTTTAMADAAPGSAKKPKVKLLTKGQKQILHKRGLKVKVKGLDGRKTKIKAKSTTFDQQEPRKLAKPKKLRQGHAKATLRLTPKGKNRIKSCEARKITISAKGAGKARA